MFDACAYICLAMVCVTSSVTVAVEFVVLWLLMKPEDRYRPIYPNGVFLVLVSFVHEVSHRLAMQIVEVAYKIHFLSLLLVVSDALFDSQHNSLHQILTLPRDIQCYSKFKLKHFIDFLTFCQ